MGRETSSISLHCFRGLPVGQPQARLRPYLTLRALERRPAIPLEESLAGTSFAGTCSGSAPPQVPGRSVHFPSLATSWWPVPNHGVDAMDLSIIIPVLNEEENLPRLLASVQKQLFGSGLTYELIVADNGSTDRTPVIATENGATVVDAGGLTVGGARNRGAQEAEGNILVFLDADMILREGWVQAMQRILPQLAANQRQIIGGSIAAPPNASWIAQAWFPDRPVGTTGNKGVRYVGSAHLLISRSFFNELGGFDPELRSAEDYDLCVRGRGAGAQIYKEPALSACHEGTPNSLQAFFRRELWHGGSGRLPQILKQRIMWLAGPWLILHLALPLLAFAWWRTECSGCGPLFLANATLLIFLPFVLAVRKGGATPIKRTITRSALHYIYLWARAIALVKALITPPKPVSGQQQHGRRDNHNG